MATTEITLPSEHVRALDTLRSRLVQASTSISLLKGQLERSETLPPWPSLQQNAATVEYNLRQVQETMVESRDFLTRAHAYPLPSFPGSTQDGLLQTLLRKKLEPRTEDWLEEHSHVEKNKKTKLEDSRTSFDPAGLRGLWDWAHSEADQLHWELEEQDAFRDNFTLAERKNGVKNVVTGVKRNLDTADSQPQEDDEANDRMEIDEEPLKGPGSGANIPPQPMPPPMILESLLTLASSGIKPSM